MKRAIHALLITLLLLQSMSSAWASADRCQFEKHPCCAAEMAMSGCASCAAAALPAQYFSPLAFVPQPGAAIEPVTRHELSSIKEIWRPPAPTDA